MRAVTYTEGSPIAAPGALVDTTFADPVPTGRDLLVRVHAVSVNPIDTKVRQCRVRRARSCRRDR